MPRLKLALPAVARYWAHDLGGALPLCLHRQVDDGIVPQLEDLGLVTADPALTL